jgi:putative cell wall-binding protein
VRRLIPILVGGLLLAGCGSNSSPFAPASASSKKAVLPVGVAMLATKNTTRINGSDPIADAATVAQVVYPAQTPGTRPPAVVLADARDWRGALAASVLAAPPIHAPVLLAQGTSLPAATDAALKVLKPTGSSAAGGAQVVRVGAVPKLGPKLRTTDLAAKDPIALAAAVDRFQTAAAGKPSPAVVVVSADSPAFAMPAAGWAARSGDPILFVKRDSIPPVTATAIQAHHGARVYVLGPPSTVSAAVVRGLGKLGAGVTRISGPTPVSNAITFARYRDSRFGWGIRDPGHGLVFANVSRPLDAVAAAPLSAAGTYGPLLVVDDAKSLPAEVGSYLLDIEPGYTNDPTRGVYNHGWLIGDGSAISSSIQALIDHVLEIVPIQTTTSP